MYKNIKLYSVTLTAVLGISIATVAHADDTQQTATQPQTEQVDKAPVTDTANATQVSTASADKTEQASALTDKGTGTATSKPATSETTTTDTTVSTPITTNKTNGLVSEPTKSETPTQPSATSTVTPKIERSTTDGQWHGKTIKMLNGTTWYFTNGRVLDDNGIVVAYVGKDGTLITDNGEPFAELEGQYIIDGSGTKIGKLFESTVAPRFEQETPKAANKQASATGSNATTSTQPAPEKNDATVAPSATNRAATLPDTGYEKNQSIVNIAILALVALSVGLAQHLIKYRH